jgi:hypothetical protein
MKNVKIKNSPTRTLFFSNSEASIYSTGANLIINFLDFFYRKMQSFLTMEDVHAETVFEIDNADEYANITEYVVGKVIEMANDDGIHCRAYWSDAIDGEESVLVWFFDENRKPSRSFKIICTDDQFMKDIQKAYQERVDEAQLQMTNQY